MPLPRVPFTVAVVGVQKAATSTLYDLLIQHREVVWAKRKERHYFDRDTLRWDPPDYSGYVARARAESERVAIDATPSYLFWPRALPRMAAYRTDMRLVACFRDPVERAFSHWTMDYVRRDGGVQFGAVVRRGLARELPPHQDWCLSALRGRNTVARGRYGLQLRHGLKYFAREQWLMLEFGSTVRDLSGACNAIADHAGLASYAPTALEAPRNPSSSSVDAEAITAEDVELLVGEYADDLPEFATLSGLDISTWPTVRVLAGQLTPADLAERLNAKAGITR